MGAGVLLFCSAQALGADSDFRITGVRQVGTDQVEIAWTSVRGRWYGLERARDLVPGDFRIVMPNLEADRPSNSHSDTPGGDRPARCYRVLRYDMRTTRPGYGCIVRGQE